MSNKPRRRGSGRSEKIAAQRNVAIVQAKAMGCICVPEPVIVTVKLGHVEVHHAEHCPVAQLGTTYTLYNNKFRPDHA